MPFIWTTNSTPQTQNDVYLLPKQLDENVATLRLPALGAGLTVFTQEQAFSMISLLSKLKALSRIRTTVTELSGSVDGVVWFVSSSQVFSA